MAQIEVLLPCPFCEGNGAFRIGNNDDFYFVECETCGCETAPQATPSLAFDKWNTRPKALGRDEIAWIIRSSSVHDSR